MSRADRGVIGGATLSRRAQEGEAASFDHQSEDAIKRWSMHAFGTQFAEAGVDIDVGADRTPARGSRLAGSTFDGGLPMWIILNDAFLSVVALPDRPDSLLVRARFPDDIEAVFPGAKVEVSETRDYRFRSVIDRAVVGAAIAQRVDEVTYPNFKSSVSEDWRHALYLSVWSLFQREQQRRAKPMARAEPGFEFTFEAGDVDEAQPLIYHWKITNSAGEVLFQYVGKAKHGSRRPTRHYRRNVDRLLNGHPYRKGAPDAFREVHHELAAASRAGHTIVLRLLRNVRPGENINDAEREEQERYGCRPMSAPNRERLMESER